MLDMPLLGDLSVHLSCPIRVELLALVVGLIAADWVVGGYVNVFNPTFTSRWGVGGSIWPQSRPLQHPGVPGLITAQAEWSWSSCEGLSCPSPHSWRVACQLGYTQAMGRDSSGRSHGFLVVWGACTSLMPVFLTWPDF